jgi:hypothetical protein
LTQKQIQMTKSKEDVYSKWAEGGRRSDILAAMDEYARQEAIEFFKWVWFETKWELTKEGWYKDRGDDYDPIYITDEEVYKLFAQSKNNTP